MNSYVATFIISFEIILVICGLIIQQICLLKKDVKSQKITIDKLEDKIRELEFKVLRMEK